MIEFLYIRAKASVLIDFKDVVARLFFFFHIVTSSTESISSSVVASRRLSDFEFVLS